MGAFKAGISKLGYGDLPLKHQGFGLLLASRILPVALLLFVVQPARGEAPSIEWQAPTGCPQQAELVAQVEALLGEPLGNRPSFSAAGQVRQVTGAYELDLYVRVPDGGGVRQVAADDCASLTRVAAFSIALAINPDLELPENEPAVEGAHPNHVNPVESQPSTFEPQAARAEQEPPRPVDNTPAAEAEGVAGSASESDPEPARVPGLAGGLGLEMVVDSSLLPRPGVGLGLVVNGARGRIHFGLAGSVLLPQQSIVAEDKGGEFSLLAGELRGSYVFGTSAWGLGPCGLFLLGRLSGEGVGIAEPKQSSAAVYAPGLGTFGYVRWSSWFRATLLISAVFPLNEDTFDIDSGVVHSVPRYTLRGHLGVEVGWP